MLGNGSGNGDDSSTGVVRSKNIKNESCQNGVSQRNNREQRGPPDVQNRTLQQELQKSCKGDGSEQRRDEELVMTKNSS